jgi:hypothetical protein
MKIVYKKPIYENNKIIKYETELELIFTYKNKKKGGDLFDNLELDDIIIKKESTDIKQKVDNILSWKINSKYKIKNKKIDITDIPIHKNLSIYDIKTIIYYILNIPIENQHLEEFNKNIINTYYTYINISNNYQINTSLNNIYDYDYEYYLDIPIDFTLINNRVLFQIKTYEKHLYLKNINTIKNTDIITDYTIELYNLSDFIVNKEKVNIEISKDKELFDIIYYGFIEKYFPYYTNDLFELLLKNENKRIQYKNLDLNKSVIIENINTTFNLLIQKPKLNLNKVYTDIVYKIPNYNTLKVLNLYNIFNDIEINKIDKLDKIELQYYNSSYFEKYIYYTKRNIIINTDNDIILTSLNILKKSIYLKNKNILLLNYDKIIILLDEYLNIYIIINNEIIKENEIIKKINNLFKILDKLKIIKINEIKQNNIEILFSNLELTLLQNITSKDFNSIINKCKEYSNINYYSIFNIDTENEIITLKLNYYNTINQYDDLLSDNMLNFYNYYIETSYIDKFNRTIDFTEIIITNRINDIKIEINNITPIDYKNIYSLIMELLNIKIQISKNIIIKSKNKLKTLKETDPVLYVFNKKNTKNIFSRKCQANQQPEIVTEKEIKDRKLKNYLEYHNFTTNQKIYYHCNNPQYPSVKFLTNLHPHNYCIPCCKKKSVDDVKIKSKYTDIHNECLLHKTYDKKNINIDEKSRYVINYSSKTLIENLRIMQIPPVLTKLFTKLYNFDDDKDSNYYIQGITQDLPNVNNIGLYYILAFALEKDIKTIINEIKQLFINNLTLFKTILNGELQNYFNSITDFLTLFNNLFTETIKINTLNYEFNKWEELIIEIGKIYNIIFLIFDEQEDINLVVPKNIKSINEYIYPSTIYKYIVVYRRNNKYYYPIIKSSYRDFYKGIYHNKYYTLTDSIIKTIYELAKQQIKINTYKNVLNYELINEFILKSKHYEVKKIYLDNKNNIYAILINYKKNESFYLHIDSYAINDNLIKYDYSKEYINLKNIKIKLSTYLIFIKDYNNFIYQYNKEFYTDYFYKLYKSNIIHNNDKYMNLNEIEYIEGNNYLSYININLFLIDSKINKVIGFKLNNINQYLTEYLTIDNTNKILYNYINKIKKLTKLDKEEIKIILLREFSLEKNNAIFNTNTKNEYVNYYLYYQYNPHEINKIIYNKKQILDTRLTKLNEAVYHTNLYNLILLHFSYELNNTKNTYIRNKIKKYIKDLDKIEINKILYNKSDELFKILETSFKNNDETIIYQNYNNLINFFYTSIYKSVLDDNNIKKIKDNIFTAFEKTSFLFDKYYIFNILTQSKDEIIKEIDNILKKHIIFEDKLKDTDPILNIGLCSNVNKSYYCKNNKLMISNNLYKELINIIYYDITNPFKINIILNLVNYNFNNINNFKQNINEQIDIYL